MVTVLLLEGEARPSYSRVCAFVVRRDGRVGQIGDSLENTTGARGYEHLLVPGRWFFSEEFLQGGMGVGQGGRGDIEVEEVEVYGFKLT